MGWSCWIETSDVVSLDPVAGSDEVSQLYLELAGPAVDRGNHPAISQIDLGGFEVGFGLVDLGLGSEDVDVVIGHRLLQGGTGRLNRRCRLGDPRLGPIVVFLRAGLSR